MQSYPMTHGQAVERQKAILKSRETSKCRIVGGHGNHYVEETRVKHSVQKRGLVNGEIVIMHGRAQKRHVKTPAPKPRMLK